MRRSPGVQEGDEFLALLVLLRKDATQHGAVNEGFDRAKDQALQLFRCQRLHFPLHRPTFTQFKRMQYKYRNAPRIRPVQPEELPKASAAFGQAADSNSRQPRGSCIYELARASARSRAMKASTSSSSSPSVAKVRSAFRRPRAKSPVASTVPPALRAQP